MKLIPLLILFEISLIMASDTDWRRKILVTNKETPEEGLKILREKCDLIFPESVPATRDEILKLIPGVDGILWVGHYALNGEVLDLGMPTLKSISTMSAVLSDAVADEAIGLMIAAGRRFHEGRLKIENSEWAGGPQWMLGQDIKAKTIGIIGLGQIGQTIAKRLKGFDVRRILYSGRKPKPEGDKLGAKFVPQTELLKGSDYVFLSVPLNNSTRHMINATTLREMKRTAVLINVARGEIVDQEALVAALKDGTIFAAGLDVMTPEPLPADSELLKLPNSVIVSHLGSATRRTRDDMAVLAALNVLAGIDGSPMFAPYPY
ncbi:glyoxylate reductase/hydroxypyruvate reductase-like isoform X2 [Toxorhynchites rutilus septentrionalis]|uniref:glyoxylate reductase/hydroxypyruvate reductase-like isoform X2 n=1 Tax=Toxorhynchites rutilus septentrionalis TaxID=329112 RepID=UPI002478BB42|nr:glyoxylate reductase/hydroxypyruvate reductase-like isoform X2 [Toxorhynchites rutilus septentrionalis]